MSPKEHRGMLSALTGPTYTLGLLAVLAMNIGFARFCEGWRVGFALVALMALIFSIGMWIAPHTPRCISFFCCCSFGLDWSFIRTQKPCNYNCVLSIKSCLLFFVVFCSFGLDWSFIIAQKSCLVLKISSLSNRFFCPCRWLLKVKRDMEALEILGRINRHSCRDTFVDTCLELKELQAGLMTDSDLRKELLQYKYRLISRLE